MSATSDKPTAARRLPAGAFAALRTWPDILDRSRHGPYPFLPLGFGEQTALVRAALERAAGHAAADGSVPLLPEVRAALAPPDGGLAWCDLVERAKWSGQAPLSLNEQLALAEWLPVIREALA